MVERTAVTETSPATPEDRLHLAGQLLTTVEFLRSEKHEMSGVVTLDGLRLIWRCWKDLAGKWYSHAPYCPEVPSQRIEEMSQPYQDFFNKYWADPSLRSQFGEGVVLICTEKEKGLG